MIKDKNGIEIKIGDRVHYKRPETSYEMPHINGRTKTMIRPARDIIFTVDEFVDSPFSNGTNKWVTGPELDSTITGRRNAVSPTAVTKMVTMVRRIINQHSFK